jgi:hypothetical protein
MPTTQIEVFNRLQKDDLKKIFLTKDDKIDLHTRMDSHFKWLAGIVIAMFGLAIAILKIA